METWRRGMILRGVVMSVGGPGDFNKKPKNFKSHFRKFQILFYLNRYKYYSTYLIVAPFHPFQDAYEVPDLAPIWYARSLQSRKFLRDLHRHKVLFFKTDVLVGNKVILQIPR